MVEEERRRRTPAERAEGKEMSHSGARGGH